MEGNCCGGVVSSIQRSNRDLIEARQPSAEKSPTARRLQLISCTSEEVFAAWLLRAVLLQSAEGVLRFDRLACGIMLHLKRDAVMNTAGRLLTIYTRLGACRGTDRSMLKVWAEVFELPSDSRHLEDEVITCLQALRAEMELLRTKLLQLDAPEDLMHPGIARFRNVASPMYLGQSWSNHIDEISKPENGLAFRWATWVLRGEDENELPDEELVALRSELDSLEKSLQETAMPAYLQDFVQRQVIAIRAALRVYRVQGVKPIEEALHKVAGAYTIEKARVEAACANAAEPAKNVFARAANVFKKTAEVADQLDKIRTASEGAYALAARVAPVVLGAVMSST